METGWRGGWGARPAAVMCRCECKDLHIIPQDSHSPRNHHSLCTYSALSTVHGPCSQPTSEDAKGAWEAARRMQGVACGLAGQTQRPDSVRLAGAKVLEGVVLMYTAETAPRLAGGCGWGHGVAVTHRAMAHRVAVGEGGGGGQRAFRERDPTHH